MFLGDVNDNFLGHAGVILSSHADLNVGSCTKTGKCCNGDTLLSAESEKSLLSVVWVKLDLEDGWLDGCVVADVSYLLSSEVAYSNVLY